MHRPALTFARFVHVAENRAALLAVQEVLDCLRHRRPRRRHNPLYLHGPTGSGKTHLVSALIDELTRACPDLIVHVLPAGDLNPTAAAPDANDPDPITPARGADVLVVEDVQHLSLRASETLVQLLDDAVLRQRQVVLTALTGPAQLSHRGEALPTRLTSRLAAGLVVALIPLAAESRLALLRQRAEERQLTIAPPVLAWLADHLPGGLRQLDGALTRLEELLLQPGLVLTVPLVAEHFREQANASRVTVERIAQRVSGYFQMEPRQLQSRRRYRGVLVPRQIGMYLARQLTALSLAQIGAYFGGRDHTTVLHACRKVEQALTEDAALSGAVRQLHADLA